MSRKSFKTFNFCLLTSFKAGNSITIPKNNATPDFWSFDNPIVVTMSALLTFGVIAAAARENGALTFDALLLLAGLAFGANRLTLK